VPAELVVWPTAFTEAGNDLSGVSEQVQAYAKVIAGPRCRGRSGKPAAQPLQGRGRGGLRYGAPPSFLYTKLNDLKPGVLAEATQAARRSAEQFAKDSESSVGPIRSADQRRSASSIVTAARPRSRRCVS